MTSTQPDIRPAPWEPPVVPAHVIAFAALVERCRRELPNSIDELGLAATLESWGITDPLAVEVYAYNDVFSLAGALRSELSANSDDYCQENEPLPLITPAWILRAATYLPPTVLVAIALDDRIATSNGFLLAVMTILGWGASEALSRIGYMAVNRGGPGAIRQTFIRVLIVVTPLVLVASSLIAATTSSSITGLLIGAQLLYLLVAVVALPLGMEKILLAGIVIPSAAAAACLFLGWVSADDVLQPMLVLGLGCELAALC